MSIKFSGPPVTFLFSFFKKTYSFKKNGFFHTKKKWIVTFGQNADQDGTNSFTSYFSSVCPPCPSPVHGWIDQFLPPAFNTGVVLYDANPRVHDFFHAWNAAYNYPGGPGGGDQVCPGPNPARWKPHNPELPYDFHASLYKTDKLIEALCRGTKVGNDSSALHHFSAVHV